MYQEYMHYFGGSLPHVKITNLPHEAQQQLHFIYLLQQAKDSGMVHAHTYYVPLIANQALSGCADGLILDTINNKVVSVQHKFYTSLHHDAMIKMMQDYTVTPDILNVTVDKAELIKQYIAFFNNHVISTMQPYIDMHPNVHHIDEEVFYKGVSTTHTYLLHKDNGIVSNSQRICDSYIQNPAQYMRDFGGNNEIVHNIKSLFTTKEL